MKWFAYAPAISSRGYSRMDTPDGGIISLEKGRAEPGMLLSCIRLHGMHSAPIGAPLIAYHCHPMHRCLLPQKRVIDTGHYPRARLISASILTPVWQA